MKKNLRTYVLIIILILFSILIYWIQIMVFHKPDDTKFYLLQDMAFLPISVLLVTLGLNTLMVRRERKAKIDRTSVVINEFFAEAGTELIHTFSVHIANLREIIPKLRLGVQWQDHDFSTLIDFLNKYPFHADINSSELVSLNHTLSKRKDHILRLFENANLIEHDRFTDLLWAIYHVCDELRSRESLENLPSTDIQHLNLDIQRAFQKLLIEWVEAMRILQRTYPYLYSLAVRKGLFGEGDVVIRTTS